MTSLEAILVVQANMTNAFAKEIAVNTIKTLLDSGYKLKMKLTELIDELDTKYAKEKSKMFPRFVSLCFCSFSRVIGRSLVSFTVIQKSTERAELGEKPRV